MLRTGATPGTGRRVTVRVTFQRVRRKKPGHEAPAVSLDLPGSSSRTSGWIRQTQCTIPSFLLTPVSLAVAAANRFGWRRRQPSLAASIAIPGARHPSLEKMTFRGRHLQIRCIKKLVTSPDSSSRRSYSSNGNAVVYLFLRNTKLVFTWCTALHGIMCSRSSFSYARMLLHAIFK